MTLPTIAALKRPTLECLAAGITDTDLIRDRIAKDLGLTSRDRAGALPDRMPVFVNNHAWALVRLQNDGLIRRVARKIYEITEPGEAALRGQIRQEFAVEPPRIERMPLWARRWIYVANRKNGADGPRFTEHDLLELWRQCDGRCAVTKLPFSEEKIGLGKAKRAFAPSIDKIDPAGFYSVDNCRLVMVAINFAINAWGLEVYRSLAKAATRAREDVGGTLPDAPGGTRATT